jgi:hypothetical protein
MIKTTGQSSCPCGVSRPEIEDSMLLYMDARVELCLDGCGLQSRSNLEGMIFIPIMHCELINVKVPLSSSSGGPPSSLAHPLHMLGTQLM